VVVGDSHFYADHGKTIITADKTVSFSN